MKLNMLDRAIAAVDPVRAARRLQARVGIERVQSFSALSADDSSGSQVGGGSPLLRWWRPGTRDAAADTLRALPMQRSQSRELARVNPIAGGAINTNVDRVVGTGLALVPQPNRDVLGWEEEQALAWKRTTQREFSLWADSTECDYAGEQNFFDKQGLTLRSALESGDCFSILPDAEPTASQPYRLRIQTIEADRIGNPNNSFDTTAIAGGVRRLAGGGGAQAYFVYDSHPGSIVIGANQKRYSGIWIDRVGASGRRRILHHFRQLRPEQPRGIPYLAPVIEHLKQLGRYTEAEIQAAIVSAFFTVIIETENGGSPAPIFGASEAQVADNPEIALGAGAVIGLAKGEKANFANPMRPNTAFQPFILAIIQQIGVGLGIPHELLVKQFNASYSASKAALLDAWMWFRSQRTWLARSFCQPVYETWLAEAVATNRIAAPGFFSDPLMRWAYTRAAWHGDSQGSINPKDEVAAYTAAIDARLMTRERAEWELFGSDWYESFESKEAEEEMLKEADLLPVPKAGAAAPAGAAPAKPADAGEPAEPAGPTPTEQALVGLTSAVTAMAAREPQTIFINNQPPAVNFGEGAIQFEATVEPSPVNFAEGSIQFEATVEAAQVHAHINVPAPQVVMQRQATRQVHTRDGEGNLIETLTLPIEETS
jgi:lambda family phage portal protein